VQRDLKTETVNVPDVIPDVISQCQNKNKTQSIPELDFMGVKNPDAKNQETGKKPYGAMNQHFRLKRIELKRRIDKVQQDNTYDDDSTD